MPEPRTIAYKHVGDLAIQLDLYRPEGDAARPVLVYIHGGALIGGSRTGIRKDQLALYLDEGYAVVSIDYRLAPETKLPEIIADLKDAFAWVRSGDAVALGLDGSRIGVVGHSAGGYLTLMAGVHVDPRPKALVSFYGYGDIVGEWYSKPDPFYCKSPRVSPDEAYGGVNLVPALTDGGDKSRGKFYLYCRQNGLWPNEVMGLDPAKQPEAFIPYCPERNVGKDYPPTLLLHGTADTDVPYALSVRMADALEKAGVEHELVTIQDGGHGFDGAGLDNPVCKDAFEKVRRFFKAHL